MATSPTAVIILAAGLGTRMKSDTPKVLHKLAGRPMVLHLMDTATALEAERIVVVIGPGMEAVGDAVAAHPLAAETALQEDHLGTGHAAVCALSKLEGFSGNILILYGDSPLLTAGSMERLLAARTDETDPGVVVLGFRTSDPGQYGRLVFGDANSLDYIVEAADAGDDDLHTGLYNSGILAVDGDRFADWVSSIGDENAKGEFYLTDIVSISVAEGRKCQVVVGDERELIGVNTRAELAAAEQLLQDRLRAQAMDGGATLADPDTVYFSFDTKIGRDVTIGPDVVFGPGVSVGDNVEIRAFCHIEGAKIESGAIIGPFARLRPGAKIGEDVHIGNFVEVKNATLAAGAKANHLAYVGDASGGAGANIGAGSITCNYDGYLKSVTKIGAGAFIGSNTALVAPVNVGEGAVTGAGSVITKDVEAGALAVARGLQSDIPGWAAKRRFKAKPDKN